MLDITKQEDKKPFLWKEFAVNMLIAGIPAMIFTTLLKMAGIRGALVPIILIFVGTAIVEKIRKNRGQTATGKTVLFWLFIYFIIFFILPMIFIALVDILD